jgi:uncharacterized membrane protein
MELSIHLWLEYLLRFAHLVAGISWIGSSFYFIWLDSAFTPPEKPRPNVDGEVFMVHGGFYYQVDKKKIAPGELPKVLHWFKWEATLTWITGFLLLGVVYYLRGASLLIDPAIASWTQTQAIALSLGLVIGSWLLYDLLWHPAWIEKPGMKKLSAVLTLLFFGALIHLNTRLFSGRGAFIQTGAVFGSLMLFNVWIRILPGQRKMLADAEAGQVPDYSLGLKSKTRSVHNTYFIFPVLFIMLSNHYSTITNHASNAWLLILLSVTGALTRHAMVTRNPRERWVLLPALVGLAALISWTRVESAASPADTRTGSAGPVSFSQVQAIIQNRCISCHAVQPRDELFKIAPNGVLLETENQILAQRERIYQRVVVEKTMPFQNKSGISDEERAILGRWYQQTAPR